MGVFFGTDGIRGVVGQDLTYNLALMCGNAIATVKKGCKVIVGRDTRTSGQTLSKSICLGLMLGGAQVTDVGIATTPSISYLTKQLNFDFGIVISASHNSAEFNGIKVFDSSGQKISDKQENQIEKLMVSNRFVDYTSLGQVVYKPSLLNTYINFLVSNSNPLNGLEIAVDCANGASKFLAKKVFARLGAKVHFLAMGGGEKINYMSGATYPQKVAKFVNQNNLQYGFCFDGDADRIVMVGPCGQIFNGDNILYCLSNVKHIINGTKIVGTSLSNLGLEVALKKRNILLERADVGDKYVIQKMVENNINIGGEQSGHIIVNSMLPSGDGLLVSLLLCNIIGNNNPSDFMNFKAFPQVMINVSTTDKIRSMGSEELAKAISYATEELAGNGRILVRPSGTENKIRVMVEAQNEAQAYSLAQYIANKI